MERYNLVSKHPDELVAGCFYLCGRCSLVEEIDWMLMQYDGEIMRIPDTLSSYHAYDVEIFLCSPDGVTDDYLIFDLPDTALQLSRSPVN